MSVSAISPLVRLARALVGASANATPSPLDADLDPLIELLQPYVRKLELDASACQALERVARQIGPNSNTSLLLAVSKQMAQVPDIAAHIRLLQLLHLLRTLRQQHPHFVDQGLVDRAVSFHPWYSVGTVDELTSLLVQSVAGATMASCLRAACKWGVMACVALVTAVAVARIWKHRRNSPL